MIGIWHDNRYNAFNLVDDLIEPLRPMVDQLVYTLYRDYGSLDPLTTDMKKDLCTLLTRDLMWDGKPYDLFVVLTYYVASFRAGLTDISKFDIPRIRDLTE
jgi:CRISP-associated protein Cas1